ncbi:Uncharacterised protein g2630 [Pycnogonum litorale]
MTHLLLLFASYLFGAFIQQSNLYVSGSATDSNYKNYLRKSLEEQRLKSNSRCGSDTSSRAYEDRRFVVSVGEALYGDVKASSRFRRQLPEYDSSTKSSGKVAYFDGQVGIFKSQDDDDGETVSKKRIRRPGSKAKNLPSGDFTAEIWVKPEGGQNNPAVILELRDVCSPNEEKGWSIGIRSRRNYELRDPRFYFSLQTLQNQNETTIFSHSPYAPGNWFHLVATYDGHTMKLYVNGAQVASNRWQKGNVFSASSKLHCKELRMGGGLTDDYFRGSLDLVAVWNDDLRHRYIVQRINGDAKKNSGAIFADDMDDLTTFWSWEQILPKLFRSDRISNDRVISLQAPPCGKTICDAADVIVSYTSKSQLRSKKILRYRIVNTAESDGTNAILTDEQIKKQDELLNSAFSSYNVSWELSVHEIRNSSVRHKYLMLSCLVRDIEMGHCDPQCTVGRICIHERSCDEVKDIGNGICDAECNYMLHKWDGGDCCNPNVTDIRKTCYDPNSPQRPYVNLVEYKEFVELDNVDQLTVFVAELENDIHGLAPYPWDTQLFTVLGGATMSPNVFKSNDHSSTLIHELGHVLGLWHVHHGISELECGNSCWEHEPSLELGDLCSDTNPTPTNYHCTDPSASEYACGKKLFASTPFNNYMGYANDPCPNSFTPQQAARMHCYVDLKYKAWLKSETKSNRLPDPSPPPLPPRIVSSDKNSVVIVWIPPFYSRDNLDDDAFNCKFCASRGRYVQYASVNHDRYKHWPHYQPLGPPDAPPCRVSLKTWQTDKESCEGDACSLTVGFAHPVVPSEIKIWATSYVKHGIERIRLKFTDETDWIIVDPTVSCEIPYTTRVTTNKILSTIRIYVKNVRVSIDAVEVTSNEWYPKCERCSSVGYRVYREPPFLDGIKYKTANGPAFVDKNVKIGNKYEYRIQTITKSNQKSRLSPTLTYKMGEGFCSDGILQDGERCDDANLIDGDGCSASCKTERFFRCKGTPSMCYMHVGDGICEDFEKNSDGLDCGFHTPDGFVDQWADSIGASNEEFRTMSIPGPPTSDSCIRFEELMVMDDATMKFSKTHQRCNRPWSDCTWLRVNFVKPVVATAVFVYMSSDGLKQYVYTSLIDTDGIEHPLPEEYQEVMASCKNNPLVLHAVHNLSEPFYMTKAVKLYLTSEGTEISAVKLRSSKALNPVIVGSCAASELYNPDLEKCVRYSCKKPICAKYVTKNAKVSCTGYKEGDICSIICDEGYESEEDRSIKCVNGEWKDAGFICKPVDCKTPRVPHADISCTDGTTFGKVCIFKCRRPARMRGYGDRIGIDNKQGSMTCEKTGHWSLPGAYCHLTCADPPTLTDANLIGRKCKRLMKNGQTFDFGFKCRYRCKTGNRVAYKANSRRIYNLRCGKNGRWYGPKCVPVTCPKLDPTYEGLYNCTDGRNAGSICKISCPDNTDVQVVRCNNDGSWEGKLNSCNFDKVKCKLPKIKNGITIDCQRQTVGSKCSIRCDDFEKKPIILSRKEAVNNVLCTGSSKWLPSFDEINCEYHCETFSGGVVRNMYGASCKREI